MRIRGQSIIETDEYFFIRLREPYWSAWQKFGWEQGVEGLGVSREVIDKCVEKKKKLRVKVAKYATYEISYTKLQLQSSSERKYLARDKRVVYVLPRTAFEKIVKKVTQADIEKEDTRAKSIQESLF